MSGEVEDSLGEPAVFLEEGMYTKTELEGIIKTMDRLGDYIKEMVETTMRTKH